MAKRYQVKEYADSQEFQVGSSSSSHIGTEYRVGYYVVVSVSQTLGQPLFGRIKEIRGKNEATVFAYVSVDTVFNSHYHAYQVMYETENDDVVAQHLLPYILPASLIHTENGLLFLCLRHMVI